MSTAPTVPVAWTRTFLFVLGSSRVSGNSETLARRASASLGADVVQRWVRLSEVPLPAFDDGRHDAHDSPPGGNERLLLDATLGATDLVIVSPLYWYSVSASMKLYLDYWAKWMRLDGAGFRGTVADTTLWAVCALAGQHADAAPMVEMLRRTAGYLGMRWGGTLIEQADRPEDAAADAAALRRAERFFTTPGGTPGR